MATLGARLFAETYGPTHPEPELSRYLARSFAVKDVRDADLAAHDKKGQRLNSVRTIGSLGGATLDIEENYLIKKLFCGGLGVVPIENQARI